jgi:hypothetical protein
MTQRLGILLCAFLPDGLRERSLALWKLLFRGGREQTFSDGLFASELAGTSNSLGFFARLSFRRLLVRSPLLHFAKDALTLHFLLQNAKGLINIVVANKYLQLKLLCWAANALVLQAANCAGISCRL